MSTGKLAFASISCSAFMIARSIGSSGAKTDFNDFRPPPTARSRVACSPDYAWPRWRSSTVTWHESSNSCVPHSNGVRTRQELDVGPSCAASLRVLIRSGARSDEQVASSRAVTLEHFSLRMSVKMGEEFFLAGASGYVSAAGYDVPAAFSSAALGRM